MTRFWFAPLAIKQVVEIFEYISRDDFEAAENWHEALTDTCRVLADNPGVGTSRERYGAGIRSFPFGNYLLFFRSTPNGLEIVQVLHGARDIPRYW